MRDASSLTVRRGRSWGSARRHDARIARGTIQRLFRDLGVPRLRKTRKRSRFRVLRLYRHLHQSVSLAFLAEIRRAMPFPIRKLQCDNGREFALEFVFAVEAAGIRHRYIRPRRPQQNGKVERSHRIDQEEFWGRQKYAFSSEQHARDGRVFDIQVPSRRVGCSRRGILR